LASFKPTVCTTSCSPMSVSDSSMTSDPNLA
jgi:hypothetical protein